LPARHRYRDTDTDTHAHIGTAGPCKW